MNAGLNTHCHFYDHGYNEWQCIACDSAADECTFDRDGIDTETGCTEAGRWPMNLPGQHPAFIRWSATLDLVEVA